MIRYAEGHESLRVPPGYTVRVTDCEGEGVIVNTDATRRRACSKGCDGRKKCRHSVTRESYSADWGSIDVRAAVIATIIGDTMHELMEWVTLDGKMLRDPHIVPLVESEIMNAVVDRLTSLD